MKKKPASQSAFFNPRFLISFAFCAIGALIALFAFALYPGGKALAQAPQQNQVEQFQLEGDQLEANLTESNQVEPNNSSGLMAPPQGVSCPLTVLPNNGGSSGNERAPHTNFRFGRSVYLITAAELAASGYPSGQIPTTVGWTYLVGGTAGGSAPLIIYLENTADTTNTKSTTWATAITGMTIVHNATTVLPSTAGSFDITLTGGSPFTYTGAGLYVAFDWGQYTGTLSATASVSCNTALVGGLLGAQSNAAAPATTAASNFRPETRLSSTTQNDAAVTAVYALGELPLGLVPAQLIGAVVNNRGANAMSNVPVTLNITGANTFSDTQMVASLAACTGQSIVTFAGFTPGALGANTVAVSVPADDVGANNSLSKALNVTPLDYSYKHPGSTASGGVGLTGATGAFVGEFNTTAANAVTDVKLEFFAASATTYRVAIYGDSGGGTPSTTALYVDAADRTVAAAGPITITLPAPVAVGPGNFYVGIQQTNTTNASVSFDVEAPIRSSAFFFASPNPPGSWTDLSPGNNFKLNVGVILQTGGASPTPSPTVSPTPPPPSPSTTPDPPTPTPTVSPTPSATCAPVTVSYTGAPVAIPDNNTTGVNLVVAVAGVGTISDLDFRFDGTVSSPDPLSTTVGVNHSWVGDMIFRLTSPGGTTVTFYDRPGVPASTFGCSSNNLFALTIDDEAGSALEGQCPGGTDAGPLTGAFSGNNPLSAFDGQNPNGNWTLTAIDAAGGDVGTVRNFSLIFGGACGTPPPPHTPTPTPSTTPGGTCPPVITQSSSQAITPLNSVSCNNASGHTDNSYWRAFNMGTFTGGAQYDVTAVSFGVEEATGAGGTQPVTVRLYTNAGGAFPGGTRTQIATTTIQVLDSASGTVLNVPLVATVPAGTSELVMEVFTPNGQATGNFFFIGSNTAAETGPSYLSAADCGIANPTDTATIGFPDMNIVFNVLGSCPPSGTPTPSPSASASPTVCPPNWSAGAVVPAAAVVRAVGTYFPANGMFYSIGGRDGDAAGDDLTNPFEYNPGTNTWVTKPSTYPDNMVNNMACGVLTVSGVDEIYCVGGNAATVVGNAARVFSYNPVTDTFTTLTAADNWPGAVGGAFLPGGFAVAGNQLFIIGKFDATGPPPSVSNEVWRFDPNAAVGSRWVPRNPIPVARAYVPAATIGTLIYTAGGSNLDGAGTLIDTTESFVYDTVSGSWTPIAPIPRATGETRAVIMNNEVWVLGGGRIAPNPSNQVDIYNPGTDTWSTGLPFSTGRRNFPADSDGTGRIWLAGGYEGATPVNTMQVFGQGVCPTPTPSPTPGTPTPTPTGTPGTPSPTATASATASPSATAPVVTPSPTASPAQAVNFSTRMFVRTGDSVGIGGFIVQGSAPKRVILRAIGPTLSRYGITDFLADPVLELHGPTGFATVINNNWRDTQEDEIQDTGIPPTNDLESAIVATLDPGNYTGVVRGNGNTVGVALIEVYDLDLAAASRLANISTRAFVSTGDDVVIAGFILGNNGGDDNVIVRGLGPSLSALGVPTVLANPTLDMRNANGTLVFTNNDWQDNPTQAGIIAAAGLAPGDPSRQRSRRPCRRTCTPCCWRD